MIKSHKITFSQVKVAISSVVAVGVAGGVLALSALTTATALAQDTSVMDAIGTIEPPPATVIHTPVAGENALLNYLSTFLKVGAVVAGVWVLINVILGAYTYLTGSGDAQTHQKARQWIINSVVGIVLIVLAYTIMAIIGTLFFGDPDIFINPTIEVP